MTAQRGKTTVRFSALAAVGLLLGAILVFQRPLVQRWQSWRAEKRLEQGVREVLSRPYYMGYQAPLEDFLQAMSGIIGLPGEDFRGRPVRFLLSERASNEGETRGLRVVLPDADWTVEGALARALESTGRKFRYRIKGDAVLIDLVE